MTKRRVNKAGSPKETRSDGWINALTLAGTRADRTTRGQFHGGFILGRQELDDLYATGGVARRLIDVVAQDATREWLHTDDDKAEALQDRMEELHLQAKISEAVSMARLHGGAVLVVVADDGRDLAEPLNEKGIRSIDDFRLYDRWAVTWTETGLYSDTGSRKYGMPEIYQIQPPGGMPYSVHESRVIRFHGMPVSERMRIQNQGWDYSYLAPVYQGLMDLDGSHRAAASIVQDFVQTVMSIKGLTEIIAAGRESELAARLNILDLSRHVINTILMDADGEAFSKQASSVAGLSDILQAFRIQVSAVTGIPMTKLFGISPGGLNATGESDIRNYYDDVANYQTTHIKRPMERIVRLLMLEKSGPYKGFEPQKWSIKFNPLWQMSDVELAGLKKMVAETDAIYVQNGVFTSAEVATVRSEPEGWKKQITITRGMDLEE